MTNLTNELVELVMAAHERSGWANCEGMVPGAAWDSWFLLTKLGLTFEGCLAWHHACWYGGDPAAASQYMEAQDG